MLPYCDPTLFGRALTISDSSGSSTCAVLHSARHRTRRRSASALSRCCCFTEASSAARLPCSAASSAAAASSCAAASASLSVSCVRARLRLQRRPPSRIWTPRQMRHAIAVGNAMSANRSRHMQESVDFCQSLHKGGPGGGHAVTHMFPLQGLAAHACSSALRDSGSVIVEQRGRNDAEGRDRTHLAKASVVSRHRAARSWRSSCTAASSLVAPTNATRPAAASAASTFAATALAAAARLRVSRRVSKFRILVVSCAAPLGRGRLCVASLAFFESRAAHLAVARVLGCTLGFWRLKRSGFKRTTGVR